jgi:hypothetical protein
MDTGKGAVKDNESPEEDKTMVLESVDATLNASTTVPMGFISPELMIRLFLPVPSEYTISATGFPPGDCSIPGTAFGIKDWLDNLKDRSS